MTKLSTSMIKEKITASKLGELKTAFEAAYKKSLGDRSSGASHSHGGHGLAVTEEYLRAGEAYEKALKEFNSYPENQVSQDVQQMSSNR